jgi:hypothetical protein
MVKDAADDAALGDECDHPHHALAAGTDERIGLVHPSNQPGPFTPNGRQRGSGTWARRRATKSIASRVCSRGLEGSSIEEILARPAQAGPGEAWSRIR